MGEWDEGQYRRQRSQHHRPGSLYGSLHHPLEGLHACREVVVHLLSQDQRVAHYYSRQPGQPEQGNEAEWLMEQE
ncbi:hypothetical protein D9M70_452480 [compost metagenome]